MKFEEVLQKIGTFGLFQKKALFWIALPSVSIGSFCFMVIVVLYTPEHRCKIPYLDNDTFEVMGEYHQGCINRTIPPAKDPILDYDRCKLYTPPVDGRYQSVRNTSIIKCTEWVYDTSVFYKTFTSQVNFVCDDALKMSHIQMLFYFGVLIGDLVLGLMADIFGRKKAFCFALTLLLAVSVAVTWAPEFFAFGILQFLIGAFAHGAFLCFAAYIMEIVGPVERVWTGVLLQICFAIGAMYLAVVSYFIREWTWINLACALPCVVYLFYWWLIPESPRWLLSKGRLQESANILRKAAATNKVQLPDSMFEIKEEKYVRPEGTMWHVIKSPVLLKRTLILCFVWMIVSMVYYGVTMNSGNLGGSFYVNFLLMGAAELPGYFVGIALLNRIGRRYALAGSLLVSGLACLCTMPTVLLARDDLQPLTVTLALIGKAGSSMAFGIAFIFTGELLPTVVRTAAMGTCSSAARIGAMLAPYIAKSGELIGGKFGQVEPLVVFGGLAILTGLLSLLLPETLNKRLPDTIEEGEDFGKNSPSEVIEIEVDAPFIPRDKQI